MEKVILWDEQIDEQLPEVNEGQLDSFASLLDHIEKNSIKHYVDENLFCSEKWWEWLYNKKETTLNDIKRELTKKISKAAKVSRDQYVVLLDRVGVASEERTLVLCFEDGNVFYIATLPDYYRALRKYLAMEKKSDFCNDMKECFPKIYFVEDIGATINTLNRDFNELKEEIVEHLTEINDYQDRFRCLLDSGKSNREISQEFSASTGIECSPQAGRDGVQKLKLSCYNEISKQNETIKCELHTKFKKYNIDRTKQDRIYFFPGKPGIKEGRVIVKHIGKHL